MLGGDLESMGKSSARGSQPRLSVPVVKGKARRRGQWRLPLTVGACFLGLFLFLVLISGGGSSSSGRQSGGGGGGKSRLKEGGWGPREDGSPRVYSYRVLRELPHDGKAFAQGLQFDRICGDGGKECREVFWESTGLNGQSTVREVELETGAVLRRKGLPASDFGEGVTRHGDRLYQLTWQSPRAWSYPVADFEQATEVKTPLSDGWGITSDGQHLIVSDSSETLAWLDPGNGLAAARKVAVSDGGRPVRWLNELEWVDGLVWGNVWQTDCIAQVDPSSGAVVGWVRLSGLRQRALQASAADAAARGKGGAGGVSRDLQPEVVNGIAWDEQQRRLYLTGKLWPRIYEVEVEEVKGAAEAREALRRARVECIVGGA